VEPAPAAARDQGVRLLADGWRAAAADDRLRRSYTDHDFDAAAWQTVTVPGHWRSTPAFADSDGPLLYRCRFDAAAPPAGRRAGLTFDGLFFQGDCWLDGGYLGDTEGYFLPHSFEVTGALRERSEHALAVEVTCAPRHGSAPKRNITGILQHWDAADPTWNPGGLWRPVRLNSALGWAGIRRARDQGRPLPGAICGISMTICWPPQRPCGQRLELLRRLPCS